MIKNVKNINYEIKLTQSNLSMICPKITKDYKIKVSPSVCDIISKFDQRIKYLCKNDKNLTDFYNLDIYSFMDYWEEGFQLKKNNRIEFRIKVNSMIIDKNKCIEKFEEHLIEKEKEYKSKIINYKSNLEELNKSIKEINILESTDIKSINLPKIDKISLYKKDKYDFNKEFETKFYDIFFSTEFNTNLLKNYNNSLSLLCDISSKCEFINKYENNVTTLISTILAQNTEKSEFTKNNSFNFMCDNLNTLLDNQKLKINVEKIVSQVEKICTWTSEYVEKNGNSSNLLRTMKKFLELILRNINLSSTNQKALLIKMLTSYSFSKETSDIEIPNNKELISFLKENILKLENINNNIIASFAKFILSKIPIEKDDASFIFELSKKKINSPFVSRQIIASIAYQMKNQQ